MKCESLKCILIDMVSVTATEVSNESEWLEIGQVE